MAKKLIVEPIVVGELDTNCYVLASNASSEAVVIDPGADADKISSVLDRLALRLNSIILTHGHFDHIGAMGNFDVLVYVHAEELEFMEDASMNRFTGFADKKNNAKFKTLNDEQIISVADLEITVIHTPGHTPGGICLKVGPMLFSGDTLFRNGIGRTDLPGGSYRQISRSIKEKIFTLNDDIIVFPGHGPTTTIKEEKEGNSFL